MGAALSPHWPQPPSSVGRDGEPLRRREILARGHLDLFAPTTSFPDGTLHDFGEHAGTMMIDESGRYSIQIFRPNARTSPPTIGARHARGVPRSCAGFSANYGEITVDWANHTLRTTFDESSYQTCADSADAPFNSTARFCPIDPARSGGFVRISVWRRER